MVCAMTSMFRHQSSLKGEKLIEHLMTHLKRLDLRLETPVPFNAGALYPQKQTLNAFLSLLLRQGYLEKTKLANPTAARENNLQAGSQARVGTQRVRANQSNQRATQANHDDATSANGSLDEEWRWGSRSTKEIGEQAIADFIMDFYAQQSGGDGRSAKSGSQLKKEILKGANGGNEKLALASAREDED